MNKEASVANSQAQKDLTSFKPEKAPKPVKEDQNQSQSSSRSTAPSVNPSEEAEVSKALKVIREATGLSDFKEILAKMERHQATMSQLSDMQKQLQQKYLQHQNKKDALQR